MASHASSAKVVDATSRARRPRDAARQDDGAPGPIDGVLATGAFRVFVRYQRGRRRGPRDFWGALFDSDVPIPWMLFDRFVGSRDFRFRVAPLIRLYFACLGRPPDPEGLRHWTRCLGEGMAIEQVGDAFCACAEFASVNGALDDAGFVALAFRRALARAPGDDELRYWQERLASGGLTRGRLMCGFSGSPEHVAAVEHKVYVTMMYVGLLQRSADSAGLDYWVGQRRARRAGLLDRFIAASRGAT